VVTLDLNATCDQIEGCHELEEDAGLYHGERNHQGKYNAILFFQSAKDRIGGREGAVECRERLGGLLKYYRRAG
jgi:hypothetical protein